MCVGGGGGCVRACACVRVPVREPAHKSSFGRTRHWRRNAAGGTPADEVLKCPISWSNNGLILRSPALTRKCDDVALAQRRSLMARMNNYG